MPKKNKTHYLPDDDYYKIYPRHLFCGGWMFRPKTTKNMNDVTCRRCKGMIAAKMFAERNTYERSNDKQAQG
jgi:hypothetical protein